MYTLHLKTPVGTPNADQTVQKVCIVHTTYMRVSTQLQYSRKYWLSIWWFSPKLSVKKYGEI